MASRDKVVPLLVTQSSLDPTLGSNIPDSISRPDTLHLLNPENPDNQENNASNTLNNPAGFIRERRGSKSCLKVTSGLDPDPGCKSPCLSSPTRRRSVHFDASPAATVEVPASEADKAQRGGGALLGPAPFCGKEVYVAPSDEDLEDDVISGSVVDEETQRLALAREIARRQSGQVHSPVLDAMGKS